LTRRKRGSQARKFIVFPPFYQQEIECADVYDGKSLALYNSIIEKWLVISRYELKIVEYRFPKIFKL
jgi:hypothetical protein